MPERSALPVSIPSHDAVHNQSIAIGSLHLPLSTGWQARWNQVRRKTEPVPSFKKRDLLRPRASRMPPGRQPPGRARFPDHRRESWHAPFFFPARAPAFP